MKYHKQNTINKIKVQKKCANVIYLTCESRASNTSAGIGSGQNSSGTKSSRIFLIIDAPNIGQTLTNKNPYTMIEKKLAAI
jgi:hypothetical protein